MATTAKTTPRRRTVAVPGYLRKAMDAKTRAAFDAMTYSYRKEHVLWVAAAKRPETRERRIEKLIADIAARSKK